MYLLKLHSLDASYNLALEEILLKKFDQPICLLWRDQNAIILGKHQNASSEINSEYVAKNNVQVCRRISGGGAVFHDEGNINFSFLSNIEKSRSVDYHLWIDPILECLKQLHVPAQFSGKSDIRIGEKKISGNAIYIYKNRLVHHGTLLYNSSLPVLREALASSHEFYTGRSVASLRTSVTNIIDHIEDKISTESFIEQLADRLTEMFNAQELTLSKEIEQEAQELAQSKYQSWEWNYQNSPKSSFEKISQLGELEFDIKLKIEKGHISDSSISINNVPKQEVKRLNQALIGAKHNWENIEEILASFDFSEFCENMDLAGLIKALF